MGGGLLHMPTGATHMEKLLGGIDSVHTTYGSLYALHAGSVGFCGGDVTGVGGDGIRKTRQIEPVIIPIGESVGQIVCAGARWLALLATGKIATCGSNVYGQIGDGSSGEGKETGGSPVPVILSPQKAVRAVVAGGGTNALLYADGTVATWGEGKTGQLGYGPAFEQRVSKEVPGLTGVKALSINGETSLSGHALALMEDGTVQAWGANGKGESGQPIASSVKTKHGYVIEVPTAVPGLSNIVAVAAGANHSLALDAEGRVFAWGANGLGELGIEPAGEISPGVFARTEVPTLIPNLPKIAAIAGGLRFSVLLTAAGTVLVFGDNMHGVLGPRTVGEWSQAPHDAGVRGVTQISAGEDSCACTLTNAASGPCVELLKPPNPGELEMKWHMPVNAKMALGVRPQTEFSAEREEWSAVKETASSTVRSHTWTGLVAGERYEAMLRGAGIGECILEGVASY
jgi:alpha-tubulin suppressor-like RCC1 family protein